MNQPAIRVENLGVSYGNVRVLWGVSFTVEWGVLTGIVGPNGAGKSTLLRALTGELKPDHGTITLEVSSSTDIAYVPQKHQIDLTFPITVEEVVKMGVDVQKPWWRPLSQEEKQLVEQAMELVGISPLRKRKIGQLSGGQLQRLFLARAIAQRARILLLDEPFAGIDMLSEEKIMEVLRSLTRQNCAILVVHHNLITAQIYFDHVLLLNMRIIATGKPDRVLTPENLTRAYGGTLPILEELSRKATT